MIPRVVAALALALCCLLGGGSRPAQASLAAPSPSAGGEDIRDIHGPITVRQRPSAWWYLAGGAAVGATGAGLAFYAGRRRRRAPPHVRALHALAELGASPGADARTFSFAVSEIVRLYVEEAFAVRAAHRTTEELLADLMLDTSPVAAHRTAVGEFLRHCDLAKFGGWSLSPTDMGALVSSAETFVLATAPAPTRKHIPPAALRGEGVA